MIEIETRTQSLQQNLEIPNAGNCPRNTEVRNGVGMGSTQNFVNNIYSEKKYPGGEYTALLMLW